MLLLFWLSVLGLYAYLVHKESVSSDNTPEHSEKKESYDS